ncbi:peptidyl-prolyl cis-trans isomerase FKBP19, chloroplastic isoform X3 [Daucus carota subsp. sativus]|uniref:peptidyl-prolyl cis-trans isomerase FKBP19, chloroplastic isoform X3 n=1 Tax=Daucus carota subsp. sativus TaxID=79200 RepID=UPI0007EF876C|nr:PREDICTED: peptidyl-prolyl cis-trans isomerase FKBP19, chloroplastic isoform X2 [Daucus carota subsp. sativus]
MALLLSSSSSSSSVVGFHPASAETPSTSLPALSHQLPRPPSSHVTHRLSRMPVSQGLCCGELVIGQGESAPLDYKSLPVVHRRTAVMSSIGLLVSVLMNNSDDHGAADASEFADMPALKGKDYGKTKMRYPDYIETNSGLQYKDLRVGNGPMPKKGDMVVVIPAFEEAVSGMSLGGIRRIIVPPELGYPENDYNKSGPRPTTFSGQRALDFVLRNQGLIDKTLLFDIELIKVGTS